MQSQTDVSYQYFNAGQNQLIDQVDVVNWFIPPINPKIHVKINFLAENYFFSSINYQNQKLTHLKL